MTCNFVRGDSRQRELSLNSLNCCIRCRLGSSACQMGRTELALVPNVWPSPTLPDAWSRPPRSRQAALFALFGADQPGVHRDWHACGWQVVPMVAAMVWGGQVFLGVPVDMWILRRVSGLGFAAQFNGIPRLLLIGGAMLGAVYGARELLM